MSNHYLFAISGITIFLTSFILTVLLLTHSRTTLQRIWTCFNVAVFIWGVGTFLIAISPSPNFALWGWRIAIIGGLFIGAFMFHTVQVFTDRRSKMLWIVYFQGVIYSLLTFHSTTFSDWHKLFGGIYFHSDGLIFFLMSVSWVVVVSSSFINLVRYYRYTTGIKHTQTKFFLFGSLIGFLGGGTVLLPPFGVHLYPVGNFGVAIYALVVTYAIFRHQLLDIEVIIRKTLVFAGLFLMVVSIVGIVTSITQSYLGEFLNINRTVSTILSVLIAILLYDPTRKLLVDLTDNYLFQRKFDYQKLLKDASTGIAQIKSLHHLLSLVAHFITMRIRVKNAAVLVYDDKNHYYRFAYSRGYPAASQDWLKEGHVFPVRDPLIEYLKIKRQAIDLERIKNRVEQNKKQPSDYNYQVIGQRLEELQAVCAVPSFLSDRLLGILLLGEKKSGDIYTEEDLNVIYTIAQESAIAIENARLYDEQIERARELEEINAELNTAQTKMIRALRDVELANEKLQVTQASLIVAEKSATMVGMAKAIGHEVNNPLSIIMGWGGKLHKYEVAELKKIIERYNKSFSEEDKENLAKITSKFDDNLAKMIRAGTRIDVAVKTLTNLLKDTKGEIGPLSLIVLTREAIEATRFSTYEENLAGCKFTESIQSNIIIMGNLEQLIQVFVNLIKNAYEAMSIAGQKVRQIEIKGDVDPENPKMARIDFIDNGPGIPPDVLPKIWLQGFSTKNKNKKDDSIGAVGQGQGLFIVKHMIESIHKGTITAESTVGKGTTFIIRLPLAEGKDVNG